MKYKEFKDIYSVNPKRWEWEKVNWDKQTRVFSYTLNYSCNRANILFNYINYFRVCLFFMAQEHKDNSNFKTTNQSETMKLIIKTAQKDIDELIAKSEEQIKTAKNITDNVSKNTNLWH